MEGSVRTVACATLEYVKSLASDPPQDSADHVESSLAVPFSVCDSGDWAAASKLWQQHGAPLIAQLPSRPCPACGQERHEKIFESYDRYPFHECLECGIWFVPKQVNGALFQEYFARCSEAAELCERIVRTRQSASRKDVDIARIKSYLAELAVLLDGPASRSVLDVGCGVGHSLLAAKEAGFTGDGVEANATAVDLAKGNGLNVFLPEQLSRNVSYGLLTMWETLEHINAPREVLSAYLPHLDQGGLVAVTVPNLRAPAVYLQRADCIWIHGGSRSPGHINLFHAGGMFRLMDSLGLAVIDVDGQYNTNWVDLVSYFLGLQRGARSHLSGQSVTHSLSAPTSQILNALGPAWSLLERLSLTTPILKVIACRKGEQGRFQDKLQALRVNRSRSIVAEAERQLQTWRPGRTDSGSWLRRAFHRLVKLPRRAA